MGMWRGIPLLEKESMTIGDQQLFGWSLGRLVVFQGFVDVVQLILKRTNTNTKCHPGGHIKATDFNR